MNFLIYEYFCDWNGHPKLFLDCEWGSFQNVMPGDHSGCESLVRFPEPHKMDYKFPFGTWSTFPGEWTDTALSLCGPWRWTSWHALRVSHLHLRKQKHKKTCDLRISFVLDPPKLQSGLWFSVSSTPVLRSEALLNGPAWRPGELKGRIPEDPSPWLLQPRKPEICDRKLELCVKPFTQTINITSAHNRTFLQHRLWMLNLFQLIKNCALQSAYFISPQLLKCLEKTRQFFFLSFFPFFFF